MRRIISSVPLVDGVPAQKIAIVKPSRSRRHGFCTAALFAPATSHGFPMNTHGGGLSYTHPGMYGMFILIEAVRQLRGECGERQVPGAKLACVNGTGGILSATGTLILGSD